MLTAYEENVACWGKKNGQKNGKKKKKKLKLVSIGQTPDTVMESPVQTLTVVPGQLKGLLLSPKPAATSERHRPGNCQPKKLR